MTRPRSARCGPITTAARPSARHRASLGIRRLLGIFFVYPIGTIVSRAFTDHTSSFGGPFANLSWFFGDSTQITILLRTLYTSAVVTAICLLIGYPFAYIITIVGRRLQVLLLKWGLQAGAISGAAVKINGATS